MSETAELTHESSFSSSLVIFFVLLSGFVPTVSFDRPIENREFNFELHSDGGYATLPCFVLSSTCT